MSSNHESPLLTPLSTQTEAALMAGESVLEAESEASVLTAPLIIEGELCGAFVVGSQRSTPFYPQQHASLEILVAQASATARQMRTMDQLRTALDRQKQIADALQRAFTPLGLPSVPGLSFDALYVPAEDDALVGGDWYDVFEHTGGIIEFTIGDVTGHGIDAAAHMQQLRQAIYIASQDTLDPAEVLARVNRGMTRLRTGIATAIVGFIDQRTSTIRYAIAGHPPPVLVKDGRAVMLPYGGLALGVESMIEYETITRRWQGDEALVLYTDGLIEAEHDAVLGEKLLLAAAAQTLGEVPGGEASAIYRNIIRRGATDDVAILIIRLHSSSDWRSSLEYEHRVSARVAFA